MYRSEGWKNPELEFEKKQEDWRKHGIVASCSFSTPANAFEAGADAMLEGLKKDALYSNDSEKMFCAQYISAVDMIRATDGKKGYLVFIPEEEKEGDDET